MTLNELWTAVLERLQVASPGMPVDADDAAKVEEKYTGLHAMLLDDGLVTWSSTEEVPAKAQEPVIAMLAALCAHDFGVPEPRYSKLREEGAYALPQPSLAERQLRKALASTYQTSDLRTCYF